MIKLDPIPVAGSIWDEGGKSGIVQILISHESYMIKSLQLVYVENEEVLHSKIHGKPDGLIFNIVTLDYPTEFLTSVSGLYNVHTGDGLVAIAFGSNKRMYGPFGATDAGNAPEYSSAEYFYRKFNYEFGPPSSCFAGFHGSVYNSCVNAIGIYIKPITSLAELKPIKSPVVEPDPEGPFLKLDPTESLAELNIK